MKKVTEPSKLLLIYGEDAEKELFARTWRHRGKYAEQEMIRVNEGMERITEKIHGFQTVVIGNLPVEQRNLLFKYCYANQVKSYILPKISDVLLMGAVQGFRFDTPFLMFRGYALSMRQRFTKRLFDLILVIPLLVLLSPLMLLIALAVKLEDGGPVVYRQTRLTMDERKFQIYKFQSMVVDAEREGAVLAAREDGRITGVGHFLRRFRLDEILQLFNILRGEMSFVGPRPERPEMAEEYKKTMPEFSFRNHVPAGLTGYAQVYGNYDTMPYDKLKFDLFYIMHYSLWTDIKLILMTIKAIFFRKR